MAEPYVGQLSLVGFNFAPHGWMIAAGQLLDLYKNTALYSLLGTTYGGNGRDNFGLPNLQGSVAVGFGQGAGLQDYALGQTGGEIAVILKTGQVPSHNHAAQAHSGRENAQTCANNSFADSAAGAVYSTSSSSGTQMSGSGISMVGSGGPHNNMMPFLALNWIIALQGIFPPHP